MNETAPMTRTPYTKRTLVRAILATLAIANFSACNSLNERQAISNQVQADVELVRNKLDQIRTTDARTAEVGREINAAWLGGQTVKVARRSQLPAVLRQPIRYSSPDSPTLQVHAERISKIIGIPVRVTTDALIPLSALGSATGQSSAAIQDGSSSGAARVPAALTGALPAPLAMYGPVNAPLKRGFIIDQMSMIGGTYEPVNLLDRLCASFGVGWDYSHKDNAVTISRLVTRTYTVATILNTDTIGNTITKRSSTGDSSGSSNGATQAGSGTSSSDVNVKSSASFEVIKSIKDALETTLTPSVGKYAVSTSGIITVTDTREVHDQVRTLIDAENKALGRQIRVRMQVVEITTNDDSNLGVDWSWAINNAAAKWSGGIYSPSGQSSTTGMGQLGVIRTGDNSTTRSFIQALATVGKVTIRKDETYSMLNNRPSSVATTESYVYPARSGSASSANTGTGSPTVVPSVEPGQLTTGTFLTMLASVQPNGSVVMQFAMDASMRGESKTFVSNGVTLEYPPSNANQYSLYGSAPSGQTALLAGIDSSQRTSTDRSMDGALSPLLGGSIVSSTSRHAVLVLLTPQIIEGVL